jgi:hypothetical protein
LEQLGPNVGFTRDPFKDGKTSISSNYRISYDRHMMAATSRNDDQNQGGLNITLTSIPFTRFSDPNIYQQVGGKAAILPLGPVPAIFTPPPFTRQGREYAFAEDIRTPYTQGWSFRIQRQIASGKRFGQGYDQRRHQHAGDWRQGSYSGTGAFNEKDLVVMESFVW